jgi:transketolase
MGLASSGLTPFLTTFAPFITMRCLEQIRNAAYANFDIKLIGSESGFSLGTLGVTHYGLEDIGVLRSISGLTIMSPADGVELAKMLEASSKTYGPVYIRLGGTKNLPRVYEDDYKFEIGKAVTLKDGNDAAIIATGVMVAKAMEAVKILSTQGFNVRLINIHTIKPIDKNVILKAAKETKQIVTIEEHNINGGLGSAVADVLAEAGIGTLTKLGIPDAFSNTIAPYEDLLERYGLTPSKIAAVVKSKISK